MKHLIEYFLEELSDDKVKNIKKYVDNENFEIVLPKIIKACKEADLIGEHFKTYFTNKGLDNKSFDDNKEAELGLRIGAYFAEDNKNQILKDIVKDNGVITFDQLYKGNNIFKFCKKFQNVAKKISSIINVTSHHANVGQFEILLKFLLKENGAEHDHGDVSIKLGDKDFGLEVKGGYTLKGGAAICGQTTRSIKETSDEFCDILNISKPSKKGFMGSAKANINIAQVLNDNNITDIDKIIDAYVKAFAYQYQIDDKKQIDDLIFALVEYNNKEKIFSINDNKIEINSLTNITGAVQLYFYNKKDKWDAICAINQSTGDYSILMKDELLDFNKVFNKVSFYYFEGNAQATGRRCISRIFPKYN